MIQTDGYYAGLKLKRDRKPQRRPKDDEPCALYRHFDATGVLLYVGVAANALYRLAEHSRKSSWRDLIATITIERFETRIQAKQAEATAIADEKPLRNIVHAKGHSGDI